MPTTNRIKENDLNKTLLYSKLNFLNFFKTKYVNRKQNGIIRKNKISSKGKSYTRMPE
tara:strand:- start:1092 stop:1265 length:174 start_codon:yes stop_codon:yes gene_type:complete